MAAPKTHILAVRRPASPTVLHYVKNLQRDGGWTAAQDIASARRFAEADAHDQAGALMVATGGRFVFQARPAPVEAKQ